jgi:ABC-2 type transport system permease protein
MTRNLFVKEMRMNIFSLLIWMIIITLLISVTMSAFRTFVDNQSKILGMMSIVPKGALQFKGISNFNDLLSVLGFYAANNVIYMMVLGSIFSIVLGSGILLKEEYNKTAEYLLTRPLARTEIFVTKLLVMIILIILLNIVTAVTGFVCMKIVQKESFSINAFLTLSFFTLLLNLLFGSIGIFLSTLVRRPRHITTFSIGLVLFFYFIYTISKITESVSKIGYLSPFKYVRMDVINPAYKLDFWHLVYFVGISLLLTGVACRIYIRKDIYT